MLIFSVLILFLISFTKSVYSQCPSSNFFDCGNGRCIALFWRCDGEDDCGNWADEHSCLDDNVNKPAVKECPKDHFKCNDTHSTCIPTKWVCDGMRDCSNGDDEQHCTKDSIKCDGFLCRSLECIPKRWQCDGIPDCEDSTDETNCTIATTKICDKEHGFYQCLTGDCIDHFKVCDNHKDCPQGDDEGIECKSNGCHSKNCSQLCFVAPEGPQCFCRDGYVIGKDKTSCEDDDECQHFRETGLCSQTCSNLDGSYKCGCFVDYKLVNNSCVVKEGEPLLLFSNSEGIRGLRLNSNEFFPVYKSLHQTIGLDFLGSAQRVFWVDLDKTQSGVYSVGLSGEDFRPVVTNGLKSPEDISIDWIGDNFYVTDAELERIVVCSIEKDICSSTLFGVLDRPRSIVVQPSQGYVYWTQWGAIHGIFRAGMDGSNKRQIESEALWPNGLALDEEAGRLYWTEAKTGKLEFLDLKTNEKRIVLQNNVFHPFSVDVFEEWMYWSDWVTHTLDRSNKFSGHNKTHLVKELDEQIMNVHVYHPLKQKPSYNPCWFHSCSHICVLAPNRKSSCVCPDHLILDKDNQTCIEKPDTPFLLVASNKQIQKLYSEAIGNDVLFGVYIPSGLVVADIAFDFNSKTLYIFDSNKLSIGTVELYDPNHRFWKPLITSGLESVHGLSYDTQTNQLYWLQSKKGILEVSTTDGKSRTVILEGLDKPIDLVLYPEHRRMYVAIMGNNPHILVSDMDGQNQKVLVSSKTGFAVSLAIDKVNHLLFWADAKNGIIEWMDLLPVKHLNLKKGVLKRDLGHVMSIAVNNKTVFWTDMDSDFLYHETFGLLSTRHSKLTLSETHVFKGEKHLLLAHPENHTHGFCSILKGGCSHICLLGKFGATCMCPPGYILKPDLQNCEKHIEVTDNSVVCNDCVTSVSESDEFGFNALQNNSEEDLNWFSSDEDKEADILFSQYDSKHRINETHYVTEGNDNSNHMMSTQTDATTVPTTVRTTISSTSMTTKTKKTKKPNNSRKKSKENQKIQDMSAKKADKNQIKVNETISLKSDASATQSNIKRKQWLTLFIAVLVVVIIVLLIVIIIRRDDYREVRNVLYSRGDQLRGAMVRFHNPMFRKNRRQMGVFDEEELLNSVDNKSLHEDKY